MFSDPDDYKDYNYGFDSIVKSELFNDLYIDFK